jgi:hypothetical protein
MTNSAADDEDVRRIFDLLVSMDGACSGYMDDEDVQAVRRVAVAIGVDPRDATPSDHLKHYCHVPAEVRVTSRTLKVDSRAAAAEHSPEALRLYDIRAAEYLATRHAGAAWRPVPNVVTVSSGVVRYEGPLSIPGIVVTYEECGLCRTNIDAPVHRPWAG